MLNVRLAGDHLNGKLLFTWLSLVMSLMVSYFTLSLFPRDGLAEIWDFIESVSEGFPSYFFITISLSILSRTKSSYSFATILTLFFAKLLRPLS